MNMIKRFVRLTAAKYSELITGTKVDEDAFYFLEDTGELFKGSVQLTDALVVIDSIDNIPDVKTIRKGRFYVDKNGGVAGMVNDQWTKFIDPKARPINYVEDASQQPAGAKEGVFYFDGVNLGVVNGASYVNLSKFDASVCSLVKDATVRPQNLVNGHFYLDTKGNVGVAIQLTEDPNSLDYNLIIQPNTNYVTLSKVEDTIKEANKAVATAYTAADTVLKQAVDEVLNTLKGQVGALEANFEEGKAKEAKVADIAHELENLPTDKIATKEESEKAVADLKADIEAKMLNKVEVVVGKQLSTEDFTTEEKEKLAGLEKYTLPVASEEELGGVKVGEGLYVTDGKLNVHEQDLSAYAKTAAVEEKLNDYAKAVEVQTQLEAYAKKTELPSIEGLAKTTEVDAKLVDYAKEAEVNTKLAEKADATVIPTLATKAEVTAAVEGVAKTAEVDTKLADYAKTADIANTYATKEAINAVAGLDADTVAELKVLAQNSDLTTVAAKVANVYTKAESDAKLVDYAKKTDVETKLAAKADVTAIPDVSGLATKAEVATAVAGVQVPSIEGLAKTTEVDSKLADYAKTAEVDAKLADYAKKTELPDVSGLATKQEVTDAVAGVQVPSIEGLAKTTEVEAKLADYAKTAEVDTKLADYAKTAEIAETYATKEAINAVAGLDADTVSTLKTLAQNSDLTTVAEKVKNVYTKAETDDKLAAKADVTAIPDVSGLATKAEVAAITVPSIEGLAKTTDVETKLADYATKAEVTAAVAGVEVPSIEGLAKTTEVEAKLADYAKKTELPSIEGLAKTTDVEATYAKKTELPDVTGLATKAELPSIEGLAKTTEVDTKLADYAKTAEVEATYAKKTELPSVEGLATKAEVAETYATKEAVNAVAGLDAETVNTLKTLAQNSDLTTVAEKVKNVYTKAETDTKLEAKADVTAIPDVSGLATKAEVAAAVAGVQVPSIEGLAKTTEVEAKLATKADVTDIPDVSGLATKAEVETTYAKKTELPDVSGLATKAEVAAITVPSVEGLAKTTEVETKLADYAKKTELPSIEGLATKAEVTEAVTGLAKASEVAETYATKEAVNAVAGLDADTVNQLKALARNSDLTTVAEKVKNVYTKSETDDKLAAKADVTAIPDVSGLATKQEVTDAVAGVQVPSIEGLAKTTDVEATYAKKSELPDVSGLATKQEVNNAVAAVQVPSIEGLAKTTEVETKLADYAKKTELPSIEGLAKTTEVDTKLADYAKKTELPDISGLATKAEVAAITVPSVEGFVKGTEVDAKLVDYAKKAEVETTYAKKTELPDVSGLATKAEVISAVAAVEVPSIEGLAKTTEVEAKLADYAKTTDIEAAYAKKAELPSIEGLAKTTEVDTKLADYAKSADIANTYATKEAVNAVAGLDVETVNSLKALAQNSDLATVADKVKNVYTKAETDTKLATKADVTAIPDVSGLAVKTEVETTYAKKTELPDVSGLATKAEVAAINVPSIEGLAKTTEVDTKLADYAKKTELPSIEGLAKTTEVDTKLAAKADVSAIPDVSGLATKAEVAAVDAKFATKADASAIPSIEGLAKTTDIEAAYAKKTELPDVSGLATKAEVEALKTELVTEETLTENINQFSTNVDGKINEAKGELEAKVTAVDTKLADYAKKTELPSIEGLATKAEVTAAVAGVQVPSIEGLAKTTEVDTKLADYAKTADVESTYAKKTELPDVSGLATKAEVAAINVPSIEGLAKTTEVDTKLADYAKKTELPDVSGLAVKTEVETTYAKKTELPDISGLATKAELPSIEGLAKTTEVVVKSVYDTKVAELESTINDLKAKLAAVASGTTEQRPTENLVVGQQYFDTTLGVPVYWNGTEWHNPFANITTVEVEH